MDAVASVGAAGVSDTTSPIPTMFALAEAARLLGVSEEWLRTKLRDRTFAGVKIAGRWRMTEDQIRAVIDASSTTVRVEEPIPSSGLSRRSRTHRRLQLL